MNEEVLERIATALEKLLDGDIPGKLDGIAQQLDAIESELRTMRGGPSKSYVDGFKEMGKRVREKTHD